MATTTETRPPLRERAVEELKEFVVLTVYLFVCFAVLLYFKAAVSPVDDVRYAPLATAAIKSAICAKFILMGRMLHLGERFKKHPLIIPTLYKSLVFLAVLVTLTVIEEVVVGLIHGRSMIESISELGGGTLGQMVATCSVVMLILVPYFAFRTLGELVGDRHLVRLFFERRR